VPGSVDFLLVCEPEYIFDSGCGHVVGIVFHDSLRWENHFGDVNVLSLCLAGGVSGVEASVDGLIVGGIVEGEPLEGEGGPFQFVDEKAVVEEACVLHPD